MNSFRLSVLWFICAGLLFMPQLLVAEDTSGKNRYGLIFSPFGGDDMGKYSVLRDSIQEMLISRLSVQEQVQVIENGLSRVQLAQVREDGYLEEVEVLGEQVFLVSGELFDTQAGLKIQVVIDPLTRIAQQSQSKAPLRFSKFCSEDSIIDSISLLAEDISQQLFETQVSTVLPQEQEEISAFTTSHPEEAYKRGVYTSLATVSEGEGYQVRNVGARSRYTFKEDLLGVRVMDLDGDGTEEIALFFSHKIEIRRFVGRELFTVGSSALPRAMRVHAVNIADLDGDGTQEIYLSATDGVRVASAILSWKNEEGFIWHAKNIRYYIRPVVLPEKGLSLAVQRRGHVKTDLRRAGVFVATLSGEGVDLGRQLALPESVNLFDFYYADLDGDGVQEMVAFDSRNHLKVYNSANELLWVSEKLYGGSKTYIGPSRATAVDKQSISNFSVDEDADRELLYVPGRIIVTDFDGDGRQEIVVSESNMPNIGFFVRLRPYTSGKIVGLNWNGQALQPFWETAEFSGYLADFSFILHVEEKQQTDDDERSEVFGWLYVANLPASGSLASILPGNDPSALVIGKLKFSFTKLD